MWPFKKPQRPVIPKFHNQEPRHVEIRVPEPKSEPMIVEENLDPSDSMILRIVKAIKGDKP